METDLPGNFFLEKLEEQLFQRPSYLESSLREDSWMTSSEIVKWSNNNHYGQFTSENIEKFLLEMREALDYLKNESVERIS